MGEGSGVGKGWLFPQNRFCWGMASTTELLSRAVAGLNGLATVFLLVGIFRIKAGEGFRFLLICE